MSEDQESPIELDEADEFQLEQAAMDPLEWRQIWTRHAAATGEGVVPEAELLKDADKLRRAGRFDEAMTASITARSGPVVDVPRQPDYHSLSPRLQAEYLRRQMASQRPKP